MPYRSVGKDRNSIVRTDLYSFKCTLNVSYILEVEHHEFDIFIIKFFQKNHRDSKKRYTLLNTSKFLKQRNSNGTKNFLIILNTIIDVIINIYSVNKNSSFGFIGAPTKAELNKSTNMANINSDGTVANTKRFNTYGIYVSRYFSPEQFQHIQLETSSGYLIKSKLNTTLTLNKVESFFKDYIENYC